MEQPGTAFRVLRSGRRIETPSHKTYGHNRSSEARRPGSGDSGEAVSAHDSVERWLSASYEAAEPEPLVLSDRKDRDSMKLSGAESADGVDVDGADGRSSNGDEMTPGLLAAMRRASQQMAAAQPDDSGPSPATAVEEDQASALTPPPKTPAKQKFDSILGDLRSSGQHAESMAHQASQSSAAMKAATSKIQEEPATIKKPSADDGIAPRTEPGLASAIDSIQSQDTPGQKQAAQGLTAASIMTPHTKQLAAGYIPRRQQPEPSFLDRKVRTLQEDDDLSLRLSAMKVHKSRLEHEKEQAAQRRTSMSDTDKATVGRIVNTAVRNAVATNGHSLGETLRPHESRLEREQRMATELRKSDQLTTDSSATARRAGASRQPAPELEGLGGIKRQSRLEKEKERAAAVPRRVPSFMRSTSSFDQMKNQSLDDALSKKHKSKLQRDQEAAKSKPSSAAPLRRPQTANVPGLDTLRVHKSKLERDKENAAAAVAASTDGAAAKPATNARSSDAWQGQALGGSVNTHRSKLQKEKDAWAAAERQQGPAPTRPQTAAASFKPRPRQTSKGGFGSTSARPMLAANKASHSAASSRASLPPKQQAEAPELPKPIELRHQDEQAEAELASAVAAALHSARVRQNSTSSSGRASPPVSDATRISATGKGPIGITSAAAKASPRASFDVSSQRLSQSNDRPGFLQNNPVPLRSSASGNPMHSSAKQATPDGATHQPKPANIVDPARRRSSSAGFNSSTSRSETQPGRPSSGRTSASKTSSSGNTRSDHSRRSAESVHPKPSNGVQDAPSLRCSISTGANGSSNNPKIAQSKMSAASQAPMTPAALAMSKSQLMTTPASSRVPSYMRATESSSSMKKKTRKADQ
ncbi:hypothetical protein WJX74_009770 [Apatococcus lobatus]|uniref:Uncharacterized protein n=1 Tax=Apatococcus lobatus TaxID=904363 RepID=A0AAW1S3L3_9CHLO